MINDITPVAIVVVTPIAPGARKAADADMWAEIADERNMCEDQEVVDTLDEAVRLTATTSKRRHG